MSITTGEHKRSVQLASRRAKTLSLHPQMLAARGDALAPSVRLLRKDSLGIRGTIRNIDHHAQELEGLVIKLAPRIGQLKYKEWQQGHNVHVLESHDGRKFDIVPLKKGGVYGGLELRLRTSRGSRIMLAQIFDEEQVESFVAVMAQILTPPAQGFQTINSVDRDCA